MLIRIQLKIFFIGFLLFSLFSCSNFDKQPFTSEPDAALNVSIVTFLQRIAILHEAVFCAFVTINR